jgi:hypothetical protein
MLRAADRNTFENVSGSHGWPSPPVEYEVSGVPGGTCEQPPLVLLRAMTSQGLGEGRR